MDNGVVLTKKTRRWFIAGALAVGAGLLFIGRLAIWYSGSDERARKLSRLSPDECQQVLAECRKILVDKGKYKIAQYTGALDRSDWPAHIRSLNPDAVEVKDNFMDLWFSTGKHSFGLLAYAEGIKRSASEPYRHPHSSEPTPGLWLWEDADGYEVLKWEK